MALGQKEVVPLAMFFGRVMNCAIFAPRGSFSIIVLFFFSKQKVCSIQHSEKDCSEVFRSSSYWYRGTFRRQRDSKGNMTVCLFDKLTGHFSTLLSKLLSTCPEELSDSFFKIPLVHFFRSGNKCFKFLAISFRQCCQNCIPVLNRIASRCF